MKFESFLEKLYFDKPDFKNYEYNESTEKDPEVSAVVDKYIEVSKKYPPEKLEELGKIPPELIDKLKEIGFFGLFIPKKYGGVGLTLNQYLTVVKNIAKIDMALGIISLAHLSIGMKAIMLFGNEEQKESYLPRAASGEMIFAYALTEPMFGSDAKSVLCTAILSENGEHYVLNGNKTYITNANYSHGMTVFAQLDMEKKGRLGAFIVETGWEGVSIGKELPKMGLHASSTALVTFKDVKVPKKNIIAKEGDGFKIAMTVLNYGRLALGAASSGMLEVSLHDMIKRASSRIQFDKPIIEFELIQEKMVKALIEYEAVWAMTNFTANMLEKNSLAYVTMESSHCKLYGTNRAWETLYEAMQTAGGSGYLSTNPYEKRMRDFRVAPIFEGTTEIHSIYPPVSILRNMAKELFPEGKFSIGAAIKLYMLLFKPSFWCTCDKNKSIKKALKKVKRYAKIFRKMFIRSFFKYGKRLPEKEFLLRRMTTISTQVFALMSMIYKIRYGTVDTKKTELALLYYLENSEKIVSENMRIKADKTEKNIKKIVDYIRHFPKS